MPDGDIYGRQYISIRYSIPTADSILVRDASVDNLTMCLANSSHNAQLAKSKSGEWILILTKVFDMRVATLDDVAWLDARLVK